MVMVVVVSVVAVVVVVVVGALGVMMVVVVVIVVVKCDLAPLLLAPDCLFFNLVSVSLMSTVQSSGRTLEITYSFCR